MNTRLRRVAHSAERMVGTALLACLIAALLAGAVAVASQLASLRFGPSVGKILVFRPGGYVPTDWRIAARHAGGDRSCMLSPAVMNAVRGSIVVERRLAGGAGYLVHWAGVRSSDGGATCGRAADLSVQRAAMHALVSAAEGGADGQWRFVGF